MFTTLDRYILKLFFQALLVVTLAVLTLIISINMVEKLRDFVDHDVPAGDIAIYYLYYAGWALKTFLPIYVFLAGLFTVGVMARNNEIAAIKAAGVSLYRFSAPLIVIAAFISVGHFVYSEYIFPPANRRLVELREFSIEKRSRSSYINRHNLYRQVSDSVYYIIDRYSVPDRHGYGIKLYRRDRNSLGEFITAREMILDRGQWILLDGTHRVFGEEMSESFTVFDSLPVPVIQDRPDDFERRMGRPDDMSYAELKYYISLMKRTGGPYQAELVDLKVKVSYPFTTVVVMLLCVPLASNPRRGGVASSLATAAGLILVYLVSFKVTKSLGAHNVIPADLAAWGINGVFFVGGVIMNLFSRT